MQSNETSPDLSPTVVDDSCSTSPSSYNTHSHFLNGGVLPHYESQPNRFTSLIAPAEVDVAYKAPCIPENGDGGLVYAPWTYEIPLHGNLASTPASAFTQTPSSAWSFAPSDLDTPMTGHYPQPPPNTADPRSYPSTPFHSNLTPMLETFGMISPSPDSTWRERTLGARTQSAPRKRSSTLHTTSFATTAYPYPPRLDRRTSLGPVSGQGLMLPPDQPMSIYGTPLSSGKRLHPAPDGVPNAYPLNESESGKKARFRPTKEQLEVLIAAYEENKTPDTQQREALARRLGGEIKPKTLQIWFQNRRSKSRAKEREAGIPKALQLDRRGSRRGNTVDMDALKALVHDQDPALLLVPISVLSIGTWTRFLMPGLGYTHPDLGCAISLEDAKLYLYIVHKSETFRLAIPITPGNILGIQAATNPTLNAEAVAVRLDIASGIAQFAAWKSTSLGLGEWVDWLDFTSGAASSGGRMEITGGQEILVPAFTKVEQLLEGVPLAESLPATPLPSGWRFPLTTTLPPAITEAPPEEPQTLSAETPPGFLMPQALGRLASLHSRQRSFSAPAVPVVQLGAGLVLSRAAHDGDSTPQEGRDTLEEIPSLANSWTYPLPITSHVNTSPGGTPPFALGDGGLVR